MAHNGGSPGGDSATGVGQPPLGALGSPVAPRSSFSRKRPSVPRLDDADKLDDGEAGFHPGRIPLTPPGAAPPERPTLADFKESDPSLHQSLIAMQALCVGNGGNGDSPSSAVSSGGKSPRSGGEGSSHHNSTIGPLSGGEEKCGTTVSTSSFSRFSSSKSTMNLSRNNIRDQVGTFIKSSTRGSMRHGGSTALGMTSKANKGGQWYSNFDRNAPNNATSPKFISEEVEQSDMNKIDCLKAVLVEPTLLRYIDKMGEPVGALEYTFFRKVLSPQYTPIFAIVTLGCSLYTLLIFTFDFMRTRNPNDATPLKNPILLAVVLVMRIAIAIGCVLFYIKITRHVSAVHDQVPFFWATATIQLWFIFHAFIADDGDYSPHVCIVVFMFNCAPLKSSYALLMALTHTVVMAVGMLVYRVCYHHGHTAGDGPECMTQRTPHPTISLESPGLLDDNLLEDRMLQMIAMLLFFTLQGAAISYVRQMMMMQVHLFVELFKTQTQILSRQKKVNSAILESIWPEKIVAEFQAYEKRDFKDFENARLSSKYSNVCVLFCIFNNFNELLEELTSEEVVLVLNGIYSAFDDLTERHHVYKVETVGEVYMASCGCPDRFPGKKAGAPRPDPCRNMAKMALDMLAKVSLLKEELKGHLGPKPSIVNLSFKIGIAMGPVIAGVIGTSSPRFKLIGDTVNTASRMMKHAKPDSVNVSAKVHRELSRRRDDDSFVFEKRELIEVKGKGMMQMYFMRRNPHASRYRQLAKSKLPFSAPRTYAHTMDRLRNLVVEDVYLTKTPKLHHNKLKHTRTLVHQVNRCDDEVQSLHIVHNCRAIACDDLREQIYEHETRVMSTIPRVKNDDQPRGYRYDLVLKVLFGVQSWEGLMANAFIAKVSVKRAAPFFATNEREKLKSEQRSSRISSRRKRRRRPSGPGLGVPPSKVHEEVSLSESDDQFPDSESGDDSVQTSVNLPPTATSPAREIVLKRGRKGRRPSVTRSGHIFIDKDNYDPKAENGLLFQEQSVKRETVEVVRAVSGSFRIVSRRILPSFLQSSKIAPEVDDAQAPNRGGKKTEHDVASIESEHEKHVVAVGLRSFLCSFLAFYVILAIISLEILTNPHRPSNARGRSFAVSALVVPIFVGAGWILGLRYTPFFSDRGLISHVATMATTLLGAYFLSGIIMIRGDTAELWGIVGVLMVTVFTFQHTVFVFRATLSCMVLFWFMYAAADMGVNSGIPDLTLEALCSTNVISTNELYPSWFALSAPVRNIDDVSVWPDEVCDLLAGPTSCTCEGVASGYLNRYLNVHHDQVEHDEDIFWFTDYRVNGTGCAVDNEYYAEIDVIDDGGPFTLCTGWPHVKAWGEDSTTAFRTPNFHRACHFYFTLVVIAVVVGISTFAHDYYNMYVYYKLIQVSRREEDIAVYSQIYNNWMKRLLPLSVVSELVDSTRLLVHSYNHVTVLFADVVQFTKFSASVPSDVLVRFLNQLYLAFDDVLARYGLYRVEIIGDALFAVAGAPKEYSDSMHALRALCCAFGLIKQVKKIRCLGQTFQVRVGVHTGPVLGACVGKKDPRYHIFGSSVRLAEKMEQSSAAGSVHCSDATMQALKDCNHAAAKRLKFEGRGEVVQGVKSHFVSMLNPTKEVVLRKLRGLDERRSGLRSGRYPARGVQAMMSDRLKRQSSASAFLNPARLAREVTMLLIGRRDRSNQLPAGLKTVAYNNMSYGQARERYGDDDPSFSDSDEELEL